MLSTLPLTFVTIVDKGSITLAADELNLAKSAVSQNLKRLEDQLRVKLATRTTRRFSLTPAGARYYARCKEILALSEKAATEMEDFGANPAGPITITAPHTMIAPIVAPALASVVATFPKLRPILIADDERLDLVARGIDVAISVGALKDSALKARKIGVLRDALCASPKLLANRHVKTGPKTIAVLQSLPYIAHAREQKLVEHDLFHEQTGERTKVTFHPTSVANTVGALVAFALQGLGVAYLPDLAVAEELKTGALIKLFPNHRSKDQSIYAVHAYDTLPPKSVLEVINAVKARLSS